MPTGVWLRHKLRLGGRKANPSISEGWSFCGGIRLGSSLPIDALFRLGLFAAYLKQPLLHSLAYGRVIFDRGSPRDAENICIL
jgi:hypothetical protein